MGPCPCKLQYPPRPPRSSVVKAFCLLSENLSFKRWLSAASDAFTVLNYSILRKGLDKRILNAKMYLKIFFNPIK